MNDNYRYEAGIWDQVEDFSLRSRHRTEQAAVRAAIRYARARNAPTGGALSWSGGVRTPDGGVTWYDRSGQVQVRCDRHGAVIAEVT